MNRATIFLAACLLVGLLAVGLWGASNLQPAPVRAGATTTPALPPPVGVQLVAIDTTISGNDDTTVGPIDSCAGDLSVGDTLTFDLVIQGVDDADRIAGYQVDIDYDPSVIAVVSYIDVDEVGSDPPNDVTIISRIPSLLGAGFLALSDAVTSPGSMTLAALDGTAIPPWPDNHESGDGVLARVTAKAVGSGLTMLDVGGVAGGADGSPQTIIIPGRPPDAGSSLPIDEVRDGSIAVGQPCPASSQTPTPPASASPTPSPSASPTPVAVQLVAIDTTTDGNDDTTIGQIDPCTSISAGSTTTFDLVVLGVDESERIAGYKVDIDYDPAVIAVVSAVVRDAAGSTSPDDVTIITRIASSPALAFRGVPEIGGDPGSMSVEAWDGTTDPAPPANHESGEGVLAKVTVRAVGGGVTLLDVEGPIGAGNGVPDLAIASGMRPGYAIPIAEVGDGAIAVGQPCPESLDTPTPTTEPTPTGTLTPASPIPTPSRQSPIFHSPTPSPTPASATSSAVLPVGGVPDGAPGGFPATGGHGASGGRSVGWTLALLAGVSLLIVGTVAFAGARRRPG